MLKFFLVDFVEILQRVGGGGLNGRSLGLPVSRANLEKNKYNSTEKCLAKVVCPTHEARPVVLRVRSRDYI